MQEFVEENERIQSEFEDIYDEILEIVRSNTPTPTSLPMTGGKKPRKKGILKNTKCGREKEEWGYYDCGSQPRYPSGRQRLIRKTINFIAELFILGLYHLFISTLFILKSVHHSP